MRKRRPVSKSDDNPIDGAIDDVIDSVDRSLPVIRELAAAKKQKRKDGRSPSDKMKRAQARLADLAADSIIDSRSNDIKLCSECQDGPCPAERQSRCFGGQEMA